MFIRNVHYVVRDSQFDHAIEVFRERVFPELEKEPGFMRAILTGDPARGRGIIYTMWQTEEHAQRYENSGEAARILSAFDDVFDGPPAVEGYPSIFDREF